jgi:hypothetical protein
MRHIMKKTFKQNDVYKDDMTYLRMNSHIIYRRTNKKIKHG